MTNLQPGRYADAAGNKIAIIVAATGETVSYRDLDARSKRLAQLFRARGLGPGSKVAVLLGNDHRYFEVYWAAQRAGLYTVPINWHLTPDEAGYIIEDSGATALITSIGLQATVNAIESYMSNVAVRLMMDGSAEGYEPYREATASFPDIALSGESEGSMMFYSSGTTGRPKGIDKHLAGEPFGSGEARVVGLLQQVYHFTAQTVYLSPAPLYHAAPLAWTTAAQRLGATVVLMDRFDPLETLEYIGKYSVTHAQFVPTHLIRMLKLTEDQRSAGDYSSLEMVVHAAAPCPVEVKQKMIDWWGSIIFEFYGGSEANGLCAIDSEDWLAHPGSVGQAVLGTLHIVGDDGQEMHPGQVGQIWFESEVRFSYHNDPEKTAAAYNPQGWSTLGDIGYVDAEGYLYLTDRVSHMIISGGVNIYPQEAENVLVMNPSVADAAVIGVPDPEMGEAVKAVVVASDSALPGPDLEAELIGFCRSKLAHYKCPLTVDFVSELPRLPTGKLLKRQLRSTYWEAEAVPTRESS